MLLSFDVSPLICETISLSQMRLCFSAAMLQSFGVEATAMTDLIQAQLEEAGASGLSYPSSIGQGLDEETKGKLILFLVSYRTQLLVKFLPIFIIFCSLDSNNCVQNVFALFCDQNMFSHSVALLKNSKIPIVF
jgi:hypothetical protein